MRVVAAAAASALALALGPAAASGAEPDPDRLLVRGEEFDLTLSKAKVRPGRVIVQFLNDGEDPHDLRLQRLESGSPAGDEFGTGFLGPGEVQNLDSRLRKRSIYRLWCSIRDHSERGMEATLRTRKRKRPAR